MFKVYARHMFFIRTYHVVDTATGRTVKGGKHKNGEQAVWHCMSLNSALGRAYRARRADTIAANDAVWAGHR